MNTQKKHGSFHKIILGIAATLLVSGLLYQTFSNRNRQQEPTGQLVAVNGKTMHIKITGEDSQNEETIVLIPGMGDGYLLWGQLQNQLSASYRVISYDPSGFGESDSNNKDKTAKSNAEELYDLLQVSGVKPPYILVAHSNGGFTARAFEALYGDTVAGIVLIDATHEKMVSGPIASLMYTIQGGVYSLLGGLNYVGVPRMIVNLFGPEIVLDGLELDKETEAQYIDAYFQSSTYFSVAKQCFSLPRSVQQIEELSHDLGDLPLTILYSVDGVEEDEEEITGLYRELAASSTNSEIQLIQNSGHYIHIDQQEAVFASILRIIEVSRIR